MINSKYARIKEYGTIVSNKASIKKDADVEVEEKFFKDLCEFVNEQDLEQERVLAYTEKGNRKYIKASKYVGTIMTKHGYTLDILPKLYNSNGEELDCKNDEEAKITKEIFLLMLRSLFINDYISFSNANLETLSNFPIFEIYITSYIKEVEYLLNHGIKKNYSKVEENQKYLKGKLILKKQIKKNIVDKTRFCVRYSKYIEDIPQNRIIVSTLNRLLEITKSADNSSRIMRLLNEFIDIPKSLNILSDLNTSLNADRTFDIYKTLMKWSEQFLLGKGFTTFSGSVKNVSLLFSAEKLFESFVANLFKKYAPRYGYDVRTQSKDFFLIDTMAHKEKGIFKMRPDIVLEKNIPSYECIIIDTKWKAIDQNDTKDYSLNIADMYQLYAYGRKYKKNLYYDDENRIDTLPRLALIYPFTNKFDKPLDDFIYENINDKNGLAISIIPFDILDKDKYEENIKRIIELKTAEIDETNKYEVFVPDKLERGYLDRKSFEDYDKEQREEKHYTLVGCYRDEDHKKWIIEKAKKYNVRLGKVNGGLFDSEIKIHPTRLFLYNVNDVEKEDIPYEIYRLNINSSYSLTKQSMIDIGYPMHSDSKAQEYYLYKIDGKATIGENIKLKKLIDTYKENYIEKHPDDYNNRKNELGGKDPLLGAPFFIYKR